MNRTLLAMTCTLVGSFVFAACGQPTEGMSNGVADNGSEQGNPPADPPELNGHPIDVVVPAVEDDPPVDEGSDAGPRGDAGGPGADGGGPGNDAGDAGAPTPTNAIILFMNRQGAFMKKGSNNSATNTSQIVTGDTTFPASTFAGNDPGWADFLAVIRDRFALYNVRIVDVEPTSGDYLETVVTSGSPSLIGYGNSLWGIAPTRCGLVAKSVLYVFDHGSTNAVTVGEVAAHELGHSLSLSHTQTPSDLMSYSNVSPRKFENLDAQCGTRPGSSETCNCRQPTQNNHLQLLNFVGAAP